ncbi:DUF3419 family protein [Fodinibius halophilus]|uniref:BtaA family protein n=1 Tax=Fodinibius halophilus TaxID=1736908 RepID=A0A6M1T8N0_9BACT|nr:BtaA family protein [Fodinibius halophilus]NGP88923.1 BtaA family protein [Fodinibius halophilus]
MQKLSNIVTHLQNRLFESVISSNLIYNTCWEDPRVDRQLLDISPESRMVMLTSAGCNALDYLLDAPSQIHCVDINPAQNALLELKKAFFKNNNYPLLWDFFGTGSKDGAELIYHQQIQKLLPAKHRRYWDKNINYFTPTSAFPSFYFRGTSGNVARLIHNHIQRKGLYPKVLKMLNAQSLEEQAYYFEEIEPQLWSTFSKWLVRRNATMTMLGVPATQRDMIEREYQGGILDFIRQSLHHIFTKLPLQDNYFWRVYLTGSYSTDCCPNYLLERNFAQLRTHINSIETHTTSLSQFLEQNPGPYSHFILLDHQDWMANAQPQLLKEEWKRILDKAQSGAKILFRSAGPSLHFLPDFVYESVEFYPEQTKSLHSRDRVGTYESTHLGVVQ